MRDLMADYHHELEEKVDRDLRLDLLFAHWVLMQFGSSVATQFAVSASGMVVMTVVVRALQFGKELPNLFFDVVDMKSQFAKIAPGKA
jgi:hypothetical protein